MWAGQVFRLLNWSATIKNLITYVIFYILTLFYIFENHRSIYILLLLVVTQLYDVDVNKAYAIRGNSVIMKCETPSYVADFLTVISWHTDNGDVFYPGNNNGTVEIVNLNFIAYFLSLYLNRECSYSYQVFWVHLYLYKILLSYYLWIIVMNTIFHYVFCYSRKSVLWSRC